MKSYLRDILFMAIVSIVLLGCSKSYEESYAKGENPVENQAIKNSQKLEQSLAVANKVIDAKQQENIRSYLERKKMSYKQYKGVYISIINGSMQENVNQKHNVKLLYCSKLLDQEDTLFSKPQILTINTQGDTQIPFGVIIASQVLSVNTQAYVIVPSTLNYFISEEGEKIKSEEILICKIKILEIN